MSESESVRIHVFVKSGKCQNLNTSESENVRIFKNRKMAESENVRILKNGKKAVKI